MHATMSLPSTYLSSFPLFLLSPFAFLPIPNQTTQLTPRPSSEIRTHITTRLSIPLASEYLYLFPAYTEDAYCHLLPTFASCLVTATGGALTVPIFTNRRTLAGDGFWGGWREAVVTDVMPRSYAPVGSEGGGGGKGEEGEERVWTKSVVSEIPQTQDVMGENQGTVKTPARTVGGAVPKQTGGRGGARGGATMTTTAMPGVETDSASDVDVAAKQGEAEIEPDEADADVRTTTKIETQDVTETKIITQTAVVTETLIITEVAVVGDTDVRGDGRRGVVREDL